MPSLKNKKIGAGTVTVHKQSSYYKHIHNNPIRSDDMKAIKLILKAMECDNTLVTTIKHLEEYYKYHKTTITIPTLHNCITRLCALNFCTRINGKLTVNNDYATKVTAVVLPKSIKKEPGIYLLYQDTEIVYIGQTNNFRNRVYNHMVKGVNFSFNKVETYTIYNKADINIVEVFLIEKWKPVLNKGTKSNIAPSISIPTIDEIVTSKATHYIKTSGQ